ncbi:MAG: hypothetical protein IPJ98_25390 [Bryobacterales bacterium]|nr:hypothetical protein [Bryobacterales bacterium]
MKTTKGVVALAKLLQFGQDAPDVGISPGDERRIGVHALGVIVVSAKAAVLPGVGFGAGEAGEVAAFMGSAVLVGLEIEGSVGSVEGNEQVEGVFAVLLLIEEFEGEVADGVGFVFVGFDRRAVFEELGVAVRPAAAGNGGPIGEALLGAFVIAHVPLAGHAEGVSGVGEHFGIGEVAVEPAACFQAEAVLGTEPVLDAVGAGKGAGDVGGAAGRADRGAGEGAIELCATVGEPLQSGGFHLRAAVDAGGPGAMVVGHEHDDVGAAAAAPPLGGGGLQERPA